MLWSYEASVRLARNKQKLTTQAWSDPQSANSSQFEYMSSEQSPPPPTLLDHRPVPYEIQYYGTFRSKRFFLFIVFANMTLFPPLVVIGRDDTWNRKTISWFTLLVLGVGVRCLNHWQDLANKLTAAEIHSRADPPGTFCGRHILLSVYTRTRMIVYYWQHVG